MSLLIPSQRDFFNSSIMRLIGNSLIEFLRLSHGTPIHVRIKRPND